MFNLLKQLDLVELDSTKTIRLPALNFCEVIVDEADFMYNVLYGHERQFATPKKDEFKTSPRRWQAE